MTKNETSSALDRMMRERVTEAKFIVRVSKKELESIAYKFVVMEKTLKRILDEEHGMHHTGCSFFQSRYGQTKGEHCDCAMKDVKAALLFDPVERDGDHPKNMKEILEESMKIGSKVWKDVPDAAAHIRKKRDGECARCGTDQPHPDPISCPYNLNL